MPYAPSPNTTGSAGQAHLASVFYRKKALDRLQKKFLFREAMSKEVLPKQVGRTIQFYRHNNLAPSVVPTVEGTIGTSLSLSSNTVGASVSQYTSFISVSDFMIDTSIAPEVENAADLLGYRAGLSVDNITRAVLDAENTGCRQTLLGLNMTVSDLRAARTNLQANDVVPMSDGNFFTIMHPFITFDLVNDPTANGLADIWKYTSPDRGAGMKYEDRGEIARVAGCRVVESTNVFSVGNSYRTYIVGEGACAAIDLEGKGPSNVVDPRKQKFKINVIRPGQSAADPEGTIGAFVSYNFSFTNVVLEGPAGIGGVYRMRQIDAASSIA